MPKRTCENCGHCGCECTEQEHLCGWPGGDKWIRARAAKKWSTPQTSTNTQKPFTAQIAALELVAAQLDSTVADRAEIAVYVREIVRQLRLL